MHRTVSKRKFWRRLVRIKAVNRNIGAALEEILEDDVQSCLTEMLRKKTIKGFERHRHNSPADSNGRDFTAVKMQHGVMVYVSFGVTISADSCNRSRKLHWPVPQFWFPAGTTRNFIVGSILSLFEFV